MRHALVLIAVLCAACEERIVLGSECAGLDRLCEDRGERPTGEDVDTGAPEEEQRDSGEQTSNGDRDAGSGDTTPSDAGTLDAARDRDSSVVPSRDAAPAPDAGPALFPPFANPSFELVDGGREGAVAETTPGSTKPVETAIAPWYSCRPGISVNRSVTYGLPGSQLTVMPTQGNTFITDTFPIVALNVNGITQDLAAPLVPGQHYAFAVDVWAQRDALMFAEPVLQLAVSSDAVGCLIGATIASSSPITPDGWRKKCLEFTATLPARTLMFLINVPNDPVNFAPIHFDNIRPDPECGNAATGP